VKRGSRLAEILCRLEVNGASWHHQAIREVAPGLEVVAHAPDGIIEGVEMPGHPWLVGVQWHPELTAARDPPQQRLFAALAKAGVELKPSPRRHTED
jgi:putative glutamine amidotransferase